MLQKKIAHTQAQKSVFLEGVEILGKPWGDSILIYLITSP
jgi:hypothetical protein